MGLVVGELSENAKYYFRLPDDLIGDVEIAVRVVGVGDEQILDSGQGRLFWLSDHFISL